jgi:hypothetical protein
MRTEATGTRDATMQALTKALAGARDPQIMRIVASVDAMMRRGPADLLIAPLRQRLATLRPPRRLRFPRLMFHPLSLLIVPAARWRPGQQAIPRSALVPMADHVRLAMGAAAAEIEAEIEGRTTADVELASRLGRSLWPRAATILAGTGIPATWDATELGDLNYRKLAAVIAPLLAEAATLDRLRAEAATGLLAPPRGAIGAILSRVARANAAALPMMIAVLLDCLPEAAELLPATYTGSEATAARTAMDDATELLLHQLDQEDATETQIAAGTLADAGAAVGRIAALLKHLNIAEAKPRQRERLRAVRHRLDAECKARFASGLQDELLAPLQLVGIAPAPADIPALEAAARGLRVLETEGRVIGSGAAYDLLLNKAADAIKDSAMLDRLSGADQLRLIEILSGPDAALALLDQPS